jgi:TatD DNase family protein
MPNWFDTHVHLERYSAEDQPRLVAEAWTADVLGMLAVSTSCGSSQRTVALSPAVFKAVGVHPTRAADAPCDDLRELARAPGVVAIGETGFDDAGPDFEAQRSSFAAQASLAREAGLTLVLHIDGRSAWQQLMALERALDGLRVIRHYFTGDVAQAQWHAARGHYLSFGRPLLRESALQRMAAAYPADRLLIETDSYPLPGRRTEPSSLPEVGAALAKVRGWTIEECAARLWTNTSVALALDPAG